MDTWLRHGSEIKRTLAASSTVSKTDRSTLLNGLLYLPVSMPIRFSRTGKDDTICLDLLQL